MRFNLYLRDDAYVGRGEFEYTQPRTEEISTDEVVDLIKTKCSKAWKSYVSGGKMYRGVLKGRFSPYKVTDPSKGSSRKSAYATGNFYTMIMNNAPEWKKFPKREIVCTTDESNARMRGKGTAFVVLPFNGFKVGICPTQDIWGAFKINGAEFNEEMFFIVGDKNNWNTLKTDLKNFTLEDMEKWEKYHKPMALGNSQLKKYIEYVGNLYDAAIDVINPAGFKVTTDSLPRVRDKEVWTESKCLLIDLDKVNYIGQIL